MTLRVRLRPLTVGVGCAVALAAAALILTLVPGATTAAPTCSDSSLNDAYGVKFEGRSNELGQIVSVSRWVFDGAGKFTAVEHFNSVRSGPRKRSVGGDYEVQSNCRFTLLFPSNVVHKHKAFGQCVLAAAGDEWFCVDVEKGWQALTTGVRQ